MSDTQTAAFRTTFRDLTRSYLDDVVDCTAGVSVVLECYGTNEVRFQQELQRVSRLESDCDDRLTDVRTTVGDSMPPNFTGVYLNPGDVLELFVRIDEVANRAERFCSELAAMQPTLTDAAREDLVRIADLVAEGAKTLAAATTDLQKALCGAPVDVGIRTQVRRIGELESVCDATRNKLLSDLFTGRPTSEALVVRELVDTLDGAIDAVEDAADHLVYVDSTTGAATEEP
jgi:uncharacterized protein Yka (UPF0111/DUF47 family)